MLKKYLLMVCMLVTPGIVFAQAAPGIPRLPSGADAAQVPQRVQSPAKQPLATQAISGEPKPPAEVKDASSEALTFHLNKLEICGQSVYSYQQLLPLFQQYLNTDISINDLQKITSAITVKYRDAGYILTRAILPAQVIENGIVKVQIVEGYVLDTIVQGPKSGPYHLLKQYADNTLDSKPLNIKTLERYSLLSNDIPGMNQARMVLQAPTDPNAPVGSTSLEVVPDFSRASGYLSYDNRGTEYLGPNEFSAGGAVNSILQSGDQWGFQGLASSDWTELKFGNLYTTQPIFDTGAILNLSGNYSETRPGFILKPLQVFGQAKEGIANIQIPWIRTRKQSLYTNLAFDYLDNVTDLEVFPANLFNDRIRSVRLGANYYIQDSWKGANQIGVQVSQGLDIMDASSATQFDQSRYLGDPEYTKVNGSLSRLQGITENTSLLIAGIGQYTDDPLLSAEQFAFGGAQYGQAYDPAEFTGDRGVAGKAELRYNQSPEWKYLNAIQYFAFYDIGKIWNILPQNQTGLPQEQSAASTGLGFRVSINQYLFGAFEYAQPLTKVVATQGDFAPRFFVSVTITDKTKTAAETPEEQAFQDLAEDQPLGYAGSGAATNSPAAQIDAMQGSL